MYIKIIDGKAVQYSVSQLRNDYPNVSFPAVIDDETAAQWGVFKCPHAQSPDYNPNTHQLQELAPALVNETWQRPWAVVPLSPQEVEDRHRAVINSIVNSVQDRLDQFAMTRNYNSMLSACTYATSPTPRFAAEGQYCVAARDATWAKLYQMLDEVLAGTRPVPSGYADIENELPPLVWPV